MVLKMHLKSKSVGIIYKKKCHNNDSIGNTSNLKLTHTHTITAGLKQQSIQFLELNPLLTMHLH